MGDNWDVLAERSLHEITFQFSFKKGKLKFCQEHKHTDGPYLVRMKPFATSSALEIVFFWSARLDHPFCLVSGNARSPLGQR